jgi:hypothetical protein
MFYIYINNNNYRTKNDEDVIFILYEKNFNRRTTKNF